MIIDAHVHITENKRWFNTQYEASIEGVIACLRKSGIDKAIILPIAPFISNQFIAKACSDHSDELIGFASVCPHDRNAPQKLENIITKYKLKGLKLHPRFQKFQVTEKDVEQIIRKVAELEIPVLIDAWIRPHDKAYQNLLSSIGRIAKKIPHANIILSHLGGYKYNEALHISKKNKNIYFDLSYILTHFEKKKIYEEIGPIVRNIGANRLIYGSDYPEKNISNYFLFAQEFLDKLFTQEEKKLIFGNNIKYLINEG